MLITRRRSSIDFSPCQSTNCNYLMMKKMKKTKKQLPPFKWTDSELGVEPGPDESDQTAKKNPSSAASCNDWSVMYFLDDYPCPKSPSPICSSVSFPSPSDQFFSQMSTEISTEITRLNQSSCVLSSDRQKQTQLEVEEREEEIETATSSHRPSQANLENFTCSARISRGKIDVHCREEDEGVGEDENPKLKQKGASMRRIRDDLQSQQIGLSSSWHSSGSRNNDHVNDLSPAFEEEDQKRDRRKKNHVGLVDNPNTSNLLPEGYLAEKYYRYAEDADKVESPISSSNRSVVLGPCKSLRDYRNEMRRREIEAKLIEWKQTKTLKLMNKYFSIQKYYFHDSEAPIICAMRHPSVETVMDASSLGREDSRLFSILRQMLLKTRLCMRLRKKEAEIITWKVKQTTKARTDMKERERKMDAKRARRFKEMQVKINYVEKKAEEKKGKERESTAKNISRLTRAVERISITGKLPWKLFFL